MCEVVRYELEGIVPPGMVDYTGAPERDIFLRLDAYKRVDISKVVI